LEAAQLLQREEAQVRARARRTLIRADAPAALLEDRAFDPDPEVRAFAIRLLATERPAAANDVLIPALMDDCAEVALAAAESLATLRPARASDAITECFAARPELAGPLALALAELGDPGVEDLLWACMEEAETGTRAALLLAVGTCGGARSVPSLLGLLATEAAGLREDALAALASIHARAPHVVDLCGIPAESVSAITYLLESPEPRLRLAGVRLTRELDREDALTRLLDRLSDRDEEVRGLALDALIALAAGREGTLLAALPGRAPHAVSEVLDRLDGIEDEAASAPLAALLASPEPPIRACAAALAGRAGLPHLVHGIARLLDDSDGHVRAAAAAALGRIGATGAKGDLARLLRDPYPDVREAALGALRAISGPALGLEPPDASLPPGPRATAIRAGDFRLAPGLLEEALGDPDAGVRVAALENLGDRSVWREEAAPLLLDEDPCVRAHAVRVRLGARPLPPLAPLAPLLHDADPGVRLALALGLADLTEPEALDWLLELRSDPSDAVARAAVVEIGRRSGPERLHALLDALSSGTLPVRRAAIDALAATRDAGALPRLRAVARGGDASLRRAAAAAAGRIERAAR
jgi:HEAT repeat protein